MDDQQARDEQARGEQPPRRIGRPRGSKNGQSELERIARFTELDPETGCLMWTGAVSSGYPMMTVRGRKELVHRLVYTLRFGPIPPGLTVDHLCQRPTCVNGDHLRLLTRAENVRVASGTRAKTSKLSCSRGHSYTSNTYRAKNGTRKCETCRRRSRSWNVLPLGAPCVPDEWSDAALTFEHHAVDILRLLREGPSVPALLRMVVRLPEDESRQVLSWLLRAELVETHGGSTVFQLSDAGRALFAGSD